MLDTFLLTIRTLLNDVEVGGGLILVSIIMIAVIFSKSLGPILKTMLLGGYFSMIAYTYITASTPVEEKVVEYMSYFDCNSSNFNVNNKFNKYYNEDDKTLTQVEAKNVFIEYQECLSENNDTSDIWVKITQDLKRNLL